MTKVKVLAGSYSGREGKVIGARAEGALLVLLAGDQRKIVVRSEAIQVLPKEKVVMPTRSIGALDFSNPYTEQE